ncbi:uncharacterized protein LOC116853646 [Odontomachus brunneus]|uniref:uncharacterized protein LOC116853646 n=1 Tax=Odontomachus brunneus TaxID=486640 RepID=UPI0013F26770|nr:uncharacterized protein LOC116853646 [Odontomachus brunneus]
MSSTRKTKSEGSVPEDRAAAATTTTTRKMTTATAAKLEIAPPSSPKKRGRKPASKTETAPKPSSSPSLSPLPSLSPSLSSSTFLRVETRDGPPLRTNNEKPMESRKLTGAATRTTELKRKTGEAAEGKEN